MYIDDHNITRESYIDLETYCFRLIILEQVPNRTGTNK